MWVSKRVIKKHHKTNKKLTVFLCIVGVSTVGILGYSFFLLSQLFFQPAITRPVPSKSFVLGKKVDQATQQMEIEELLKEKNVAYTGLEKIDEASHKVILVGNGEVFLTANRDLTSQITSLQVILTRTTMEGKHFTKLDLRFDKPVIVF